ncbi:MAG: polysaccharide pyruvyl transferase family protein [Planctomycetota bacterium]
MPGSLSRNKKLLLRSSWQTVNIGDIAHTPGVLALLQANLPDVEVYLWPLDVGNGVRAMLQKRFPDLRLIEDARSLRQAFDACDFLLHGSGPFLVGEPDLNRWRSETGKPYGVLGITLPERRSSQTQDLGEAQMRQTVRTLNDAAFVYFRDSVSLGVAERLGCRCPVMAFGPDGAFACDVEDDKAALAFLREHGLERGGFLCCIPRLRYTPGWEFVSKNASFDPVKHERNQAMRVHDHAPLLDAICRVVREAGLKVLICPEDETQVQLGRDVLLEPLPADVRENVVWRDRFWLTDEALSVYRRSAGLFGNEMHSPIMCIGQGVPAITCRWREQTSKGLMWRDIGLSDWLFDLDQPADRREIASSVLRIAQDPESAQAITRTALQNVARYQTQTMSQLRALFS